MTTDVLKRPKPNDIISSTATLADHFPRALAFDLGIEGEPFAVAGHRNIDGSVADPDLLVIGSDGVLRHFRPNGGTSATWTEDQFAVPDFKDGIVRRINASAQDPLTGDERLVVTISGLTANREPRFVVVERTARGWRRFTVPPGPIEDRDLFPAVASGFVGIAGGKLQTYYACLPRPGKLSVAGYGVSNEGNIFTLAPMDNPKEIDCLVATSDDSILNLCRIQNNNLTLYPAPIDPRELRRNILPVRFDMENSSRRIRLPIRVDAQDASCMIPITDTRGLCHGMFVRVADDQIIATSFGSNERTISAGVLTGQREGPAQATDVAYSLGPDGSIHIFLRDPSGLIWYASWANGAKPETLFWEKTGQFSRYIKAPQLEGAIPYVFVADGKSRVDQLARSDRGDTWTRTGITIREAELVADPAVVHVITLSSVTADSRCVPFTPLKVRASRPVVVESEGELYRLGPDRVADFKTGPTGGLTLRMRATGVDTTQLLVTCPEIDQTEMTFRPQDSALLRLSGADPNFRYDGAALKRAKLVPADFPDADANELADAMRAAAAVAMKQPTKALGRLEILYAGSGEEPDAALATRQHRLCR
jgi:hypothetical protein